MKNVQAILKKELKVKEQLKVIKQEKEAIAINVLASTKEVLEQLGCEYLYEASETAVNVTIKKGRVIEVPGKERIQVVEDFTKIEKHLDTIAANKKEISALKKTVATYQQKEIDYKAVIADLEAKLAQALTVKEEVKAPVVSEEDEYVLYMAANAEKYQAEIEHFEAMEKETVAPVKKEEVKPVVPSSNQAVKVEKLNVNMKSTKVAMYKTDKCHLIASPTTDEITWIHSEILSNEYKLEVEKVLISDFGFNARRQTLSPIKVETSNGYMARVSAPQGYDKFTDNDILSGYVRLGEDNFFLYSYTPSKQKVYVDSFARKLVNADRTCPAREVKDKVTAQVFKLYAQYKGMLEASKEKVVDKKQEEIVKVNNKNEEIRRNQRALDDAIVAATLGKEAVHSNNSSKPSPRMSTSLEDIAF